MCPVTREELVYEITFIFLSIFLGPKQAIKMHFKLSFSMEKTKNNDVNPCQTSLWIAKEAVDRWHNLRRLVSDKLPKSMLSIFLPF